MPQWRRRPGRSAELRVQALNASRKSLVVRIAFPAESTHVVSVVIGRLAAAVVTRRIVGEDGVALVMALGICIVLAIASTSAVLLTGSNQHNAMLSRSDQQARTFAEAGVD